MPHSPPMARSLARYLRRRAPLAYRGLPVGRFSIGTPRWLFSIATPPAHRQKRERKRMCELLRADGADGTGGRTCTFISRFWRPLLCVKLRLQKMPGISTGLGTLYTATRLTHRAGPMLLRGIAMDSSASVPRKHKSRKARLTTSTLRFLIILLYYL